MSLEQFTRAMLTAVEELLRRHVDAVQGAALAELHHMLAYQMGWEGEGAGPQARGKRLRPLLVLLTASAAGGEWRNALPAAAAVELLHNFSLVHDDIQDQSTLRRGRPAVWKLWGVAQAINVGDALFTLANQALLELEKTSTVEAALRASYIFQETCLALTQGQFLDLQYEERQELSVEDYWPMVSGKTAALLAACAQLGAVSVQAGEAAYEAYSRFGRDLGLAFQAQDDLLGIWGDAALTGKSAESDLVSGKKSLPVLYGLQQGGAFAERWKQGGVRPEEVPGLARQLELEGARTFTQAQVKRLTERAQQALREASPQGTAEEALRELAEMLVGRTS